MPRTDTRGDPAEAELARVLRAGPFHLALRAALAARGLALHRVQHRLAQRGVQVGVTSLSYWQQGARRPQRAESLRAVRALEEVLELPPHALTRLLEPAAAERTASRSYRAVVEASGSLGPLLTDLESPADGGLHTVCQLEQVRVGPRRELLDRASQHVVRAHRDGVDRYLAIHIGDRGCAPERVRVRATENCRVGRVRWSRDAAVLVAELLFDARLRSGDTYVFGYGFEDGTGGPSDEYVRGFTFPCGQYVLQVRFDPTALPVHCRRFAQTTAGAPRTGRRDLTLNGRHCVVHLAEQDVAPGILGIGWDWT
ncbi:hypothetical protein OG948_47920 (plasmid) [Embleya sp. NBC_00888]|uniref:hypothetical protein n=1 Tax=Embleya sp. NBC_00888 TaxID=2975960 RepID=UPI002F917674|nr:hypothetical protein OG948_47920 [Embleya sp. NBC_00888]